MITPSFHGFIGSKTPLQSPYSDKWGALATRILANLHGHTTGSGDGSISPSAYATAYSGKGHGALVITDHDLVTADPGGGHGMIYVPANELSHTSGHILSINSDYTRGGTTDTQTNIDAIVADGGLAFLAHPKWTTGYSQATMASLTGYSGIEIFNMHVETGATSNGVSNPGFDVIDWDYLLTNDRMDVWGIATDDYHSTTDWKYYDTGRVHVFANESTLNQFVQNLKMGNFAADVNNYGVTPGKPTLTETSVSVTATGATSIRFIGGSGALLEEDSGESGSYTFDSDDTYVRIEAIGDYTEAFGSALNDRWEIVDGTWSVSGGVMTKTGSGNQRIILRRFREGDYAVQFDTLLGTIAGFESSALMFNVLDSDRYYVLRLGAADAGIPNWQNKLAVGLTQNNSFSGVNPIDSTAVTVADNVWYTIKMSYTASTGNVQAKIWLRDSESEPASWQIEITDTTWKHGAFGFRAAANAKFDNLYINGFKTYYQPIPVGDWF